MVKAELKAQLTMQLKTGMFFLEDTCAPLFSTEWGKRASLGTLILFALFSLITLIETFVAWDDDFFLACSHAETTQSNAGDDVLKAIAQIPNNHLFGDANIANQGYVPITSLQLHLVGIVKSADINQSHIIISDGSQPGKVYAIGDSLPSGIRVYAINDDGVILDNSGHLEKLPLARQRLEFQGMPKTLWSQG